MEREEIEKAAGEYSGSVLGFKDNPVVMNNHKAFMDGAEWRINSVWHDASEKPKFKGKVEKEMFMLFCNSKKYGLMLISQDEWDDFVERGMFHKWAYVDDLLPERKEDER